MLPVTVIIFPLGSEGDLARHRHEALATPCGAHPPSALCSLSTEGQSGAGWAGGLWHAEKAVTTTPGPELTKLEASLPPGKWGAEEPKKLHPQLEHPGCGGLWDSRCHQQICSWEIRRTEGASATVFETCLDPDSNKP